MTKPVCRKLGLVMTCLVFLQFFSVSCRPAHKTDLKTSDIEVLASGMEKARQNFEKGGCGSGAASTDPQKELERAQRALPAAMRRAFDSWGVKFKLSSSASATCRKSLLDAAQHYGMSKIATTVADYNQACVLPRSSSSPAQGFDIVLQNTPKTIHNWLLVQSFSLFYQLLDVASTKPGSTDDAQSLASARENVTAAFLADLESAPNVISIYKKTIFKTNDLLKNREFQALIFTEMSDSYFCNWKTKQELLKKPSGQKFANFVKNYIEK